MASDSSPGSEAPDVELIARWRAGDERAATQIVERHASSVARYVASLGMRDAVQEVVQDTFVRAFGSIDSFRGESSLRTWLFTIGRRLVLDRRRSRRRQRETAELQDGDLSTEYDALDSLVAEEAQAKMRHAIDRLTPTQREVFVLRVNDGLSYRDIAEVVGTTEGAARVHYHNALRQIKETLHD
jgi:RNA polymerase sigma-70 factor (ECF subfamily)